MIFLDKPEIKYLKELLTSLNTTYWVNGKILDKIRVQEEKWQESKNCKHFSGEYIGKKNCCVYCGGFDVGQGESWQLINPDQPAGRHRKVTRKTITSDDGARKITNIRLF